MLTQTYVKQNKKQIFMIIIVLISITGQIVIASIHNHILPLSIQYSLYSQQVPQLAVVLYLTE